MSKKNNARRQEKADTNTKSDATTGSETQTNTNESSSAGSDTGTTTKASVDRRLNTDGTLRFAAPYKYETVDGKAREAKQEYKLDWPKRDVLFVVGHVNPKGNGNSVMATIVALVAAQKDEDGKQKPIVGRELAVIVRNANFPNAPRSKYLENGIPAVGWAEGYIDGAVQKKHLKMVNPDAVQKRGATPAKDADGKFISNDEAADKGLKPGEQEGADNADQQSGSETIKAGDVGDLATILVGDTKITIESTNEGAGE